jgi:hypothetical protein
MRKKIAALVAACLLVSGCAAVGPAYTEDMVKPPGKGMSRLVLYFPNQVNGFRAMTLKINDEDCALYANGFMVKNIKPGEVTIGLGDDSDVIPAESGKTEFIRIYQNPTKKMATEAFGLVGLIAYNVVKHGTPENADIYFDLIDEDSAKEEIESNGMHKSSGCSKNKD